MLEGNTGRQVWAEDYDRDLTIGNLLDIQTDIAQQIANRVGAVLTPEEQARIASRPTENLLAYELYTRGRILWWTRSPEALEQAIGLFQAAVEEDPAFAFAYAGLAETYAILPEMGGPPFGEILPLAREAVEMALSLDPDLAEAHTASGYINTVFRWDREAGERDYLRAMELNPDYGTAHQWYAELLGASGRMDQAFREARIAVELDPRSPASNMVMGFLVAYDTRSAEAIQWFERSLAIAPELRQPLGGLAFTYMWMGEMNWPLPGTSARRPWWEPIRRSLWHSSPRFPTRKDPRRNRGFQDRETT